MTIKTYLRENFTNKEWKTAIKGLVILLIFIFFLTHISAKVPLTFGDLTSGYLIESPTEDTFQLNKDIDFYIHVFNISNGIPITNASTNCSLHLFYPNGTHMVKAQMSYYEESDVVNEWEYSIKSGNLTQVGDNYNYLVQCNSSSLGGFTKGEFDLINNVVDVSVGSAILYVSLFIVLFFVFFMNIWFINRLPEKNNQDEEGKFISINWLKYLRGSLWFVEYILFVAILYVSSNLSFYYLNEHLIANVLFVIYRLAFLLAPVIVIIWIVWVFAKIAQDKRFWKLIQNGIFPQGKL